MNFFNVKRDSSLPFSWVLARVALVFALEASAPAGNIVVPLGLQPGDTFRLAFVSSEGRDATSSDIGDYDAFVDNLALQAGLSSYNGATVHWYALVSTTDVSARDRLADSDVPMYLTDGTLLANASHPIWAPSPVTLWGPIAPINRDENTDLLDSEVWTGSNNYGQSYLPLGSSIPTYGDSFEDYHFWITSGAYSNDHNFSVYGYSDVLTVDAVIVPESSLGASTAVFLLLFMGFSRWWHQRCQA